MDVKIEDGKVTEYGLDYNYPLVRRARPDINRTGKLPR